MKSTREYTDYLQDILEATSKARQFVKDVDFEAFRANEEKDLPPLQAAVAKILEDLKKGHNT